MSVAENGDFRASDADRDQIVAVLRQAFAQGRLTAEEFHERVDVALASKTLAQLADLTTDLPPPAGLTAAVPADALPVAHPG